MKSVKLIATVLCVSILYGCDSSSNSSPTATNHNSSAQTSANNDTISSSSSIPWNPSIAYDTLKDNRDGKIYKTVKIGTQIWMAENLNYSGTMGSVGMCYGNSKDTCAKYGRLYKWSEINGICPSGWKVPDDGDLTALLNYADGAELTAKSGWNVAGKGTDKYGFRLLPAGSYCSGFNSLGERAYIWSSTSASGDAWTQNTFAMSISFSNGGAYTDHGGLLKSSAFSVRCIKGGIW